MTLVFYYWGSGFVYADADAGTEADAGKAAFEDVVSEEP